MINDGVTLPVFPFAATRLIHMQLNDQDLNKLLLPDVSGSSVTSFAI